MSNQQELENKVRYHKRCYYNGLPEIPDSAYDALEAILKVEYPDSEVLKETGSGISKFDDAVTFDRRMGSLEFVRTIEDFMTWYDKYAEGRDLVLSPKIDGLAINMKCLHGMLKQGATRGDGMVGKDITNNLIAASRIPTSKLPPDLREMRGECYMSHDDFAAYNSDKPEKDQLANCRNGASGGIRQKDPAKSAKRNLSIFLYDLAAGARFTSEMDKHKYATVNKLPYVPMCLVKGSAQQGREKFIASMKQITTHWQNTLRAKLPFDIDGLVFAINDLTAQKRVGTGSSGKYPHGKMAFKFESEAVEVPVDKVVWQTGRTGNITPVAEFPAVDLMGSMVARATLHNRANVLELGVVPGSVILIEKRGDIIPGIVDGTGVLSGKGEPEVPEYCAVCGKATSDNGVELVCTNQDCEAQVMLRLTHFCKVLGMKGFGPGVMDKLCNVGVSNIAELMGTRAGKMQEAGIGEKLSTKLAKVLVERDTATLEEFIACLGIAGMEVGTAKKICKGYDDLELVLQASVEDFTMLDGIAKKKANIIWKGLRKNDYVIRELLSYIRIVKPVKHSGPLEGQKLCITSPAMRKKPEWRVIIEKNGGEFASSLGKSCTYLVTGSLDAGSGKLVRAQKLGITVITEQQLEALVDVNV